MFGRNANKLTLIGCRRVHYIQGQSSEVTNSREYFYYIDHQGMLFLDDSKMKNFTSCFKEKKFLHFFFSRLRRNTTNRYESEFPYVSPCGRETNFVRCDDLPIVFTHFVRQNGDHLLSYAHADQLLTLPFQPEKLFMCPTSGRVYHPAMDRVGGVGLVRSAFAIELSKRFLFNDKQLPNTPTHFDWNGKLLELTQELSDKFNKS